MSPSQQHVVLAKWLPIVQEYEQIKAKKSEHFRTVKALLSAHHITKRDLYKYYYRWRDSGRKSEALLPQKRGPRLHTRRVTKEKERAIMKASRKLGVSSYEMVLLFRPHYGPTTPSARTIDRIKARYPLNPAQKEKIKRYEKRYPGELGHVDSYYLPVSLSGKREYLMALVDDCTRLAYSEVIPKLNGQQANFFISRALCWFVQSYGIRFDALMSDNGSEFKGNEEHPVEAWLKELSIEHWYTPPFRPQPNGKVEAYFKIVQTELIRAHHFSGMDEFKEQLGCYISNYNHCRRHGGIGYQTPYEKLERVSELLT